MTSAPATLPPKLTDRRPWAQGFNDWLAFGNAANGLERDPEYDRGKRDAKTWLHRRAEGDT